MPGTSRALPWLLIGGPAFAQAPPASLDYDVAAECPDQTWFFERLAELEAETPRGGTVAVEVRRSETGFQAHAQFVDGSSSPDEPWQRELVDGDCATLLRAVALGLVVHWEGRDGSPPDAEPAPPAPTPAPASRPLPEDRAPEPLPERTSRLRPLFGLGGGVQTGWNPRPDPVAALQLGIAGDGDHFGAGRHLVTLSALPGNRSQGEIRTTAEAVSWSTRWWALGLHLCPWGKHWGAFILTACGDARLIRYQATPSGSPVTSATWSGTAGPSLGATLDFAPLGIHLDAGVDVPIAPTHTRLEGQSVFRQALGAHAFALAEVYPFVGF